MNNYRRLLPSIVLVVACALSALYVHTARGRHAGGDADQLSLIELEQKIAASDAPPQVWLVYARRLYETGQFSRSATAYAHVIEAEPFNRVARFQRALALAGASDVDALLAYVRDQVYADPKLAAEILAREELHRFLADARFAQLQKEAAAQAMD